MGTPAAFYNNAVDLNRYSNKVARQIIRTYNDVILDAVGQLAVLDDMTAPMRAARLRAILADLKQSLDGWAGDATALTVRELQGLAVLQSEFVEEELRKALPLAARDQIRSVQVTPGFAQAVAVTDPTAINVVALSDDLQAAVTGAPATFRLTAAQGSTITLPNGKVLEKSFRGLAESNAEMFGRVVRTGFIQGKSIQRMSRELKGRLRFGQPGSGRQIALAGGEVTKLANHQMLALVRTSVNQVANAASQASYKANQDVTKRYQYTATLDNRTSAICRALDGREFEYGKGPTPPQHFNCRSTTVPIIDYEGLGVEPPPRSDVIDDRQTYGEWLAKQTEARKAEILGSKGRAKIFDGFAEKIGPKEAIRRFVREDGSELSLIDLERKLKRTKGPTAAKPKPKPKPAAKPQPKASPVEYIREHQHDNGKNKLSHKAIADSLELAGNEKGLAGENMRKMLQFQQKKEIQTIWSTGREKLFGPDFDHWGDTEIIKALRAGNGKGEGVARAIADDLEKGRKNPLLSKIGKVSSGAAGHTMEGANFIVLKQEGQFKQITAKSISRIKNAAANSVLDAKAGRPQKVVTAQLYKKTGKTTWKTEDGWLGTYVHEMGHQVHFKAGKPSLGRIIEEGLEDLSGEKLLVERAKRRWKPSVYGGTNEMEQFAETFVQFVFAPDELRKANPYAYRWVAEAMEAALK
jgi:SPP1 gp7 family putative phage head morphogenesis protein